MRTTYEDIKDRININEPKLIALCGTMLTGKTTIAIKMCEDLSYNKNLSVVMFSLEQSKSMIINKCKNYNSNFTIIDDVGLSTNDIKERLLKLKKESNIKLVVIDYLQLLSYDKSKCLSRDDEIQNIVKELKELVIELNISIVIVYHLGSRHRDKFIEDKNKLKELDDRIFLNNNAYDNFMKYEVYKDLIKYNVVNVLKNKDFEKLTITFKNIMTLEVPRKYIHKFEFVNNPHREVVHYNSSYPSGEPIDVEYLTLSDVTIVLDKEYCSSLYSITGSDYFSPYVENETDINYTSTRELLHNTISILDIKDKNCNNIFPEFRVVWGEDRYINKYQTTTIKDNEIIININDN